MNDLLVSIIVITYNSSKYVMETLESVKLQTYKNIELIISDDCSTDDTVEICKAWLKLNESYFVRTELITVSLNTGIPANCNRGVQITEGHWVKIIAGDDKLIETCIQTNLYYSQQNSNINLLFSQCIIFDSASSEKIGIKPSVNFKLPIGNNNQLLALLKKDFVNSPTVFFNKAVFIEVGGYDERYPYIEDYPMWFKLLKEGYVFSYIPIPTVLYRISGNSLSNTNGGLNVKWFSSNYCFFKENIKLELQNRKLYYILFYKELDFFLKKKRINAKYGIVSNFYRAVNSVIFRFLKY